MGLEMDGSKSIVAGIRNVESKAINAERDPRWAAKPRRASVAVLIATRRKGRSRGRITGDDLNLACPRFDPSNPIRPHFRNVGRAGLRMNGDTRRKGELRLEPVHSV
jgi:hypothetical protein